MEEKDQESVAISEGKAADAEAAARILGNDSLSAPRQK